MSNEVVVNSQLNIVQANGLNVRTQPSSFRGSVVGSKGPAPGAFSVSTLGTNVDFSALTTPGYCIIKNLDPTNIVEVGSWDGTHFIPIFEILPLEFYVVRISRHLGGEYGSVGTGTVGSGERLRLRALTAACNVSVEAYES